MRARLRKQGRDWDPEHIKKLRKKTILCSRCGKNKAIQRDNIMVAGEFQPWHDLCSPCLKILRRSAQQRKAMG
jgi:hypothetical protein